MNIDAGLISRRPPLFLRIIRELAERAHDLFDKARRFVVTGRSSSLTSKNHGESLDGLFLSPPFTAAEEPLLVRLFEAAREALSGRPVAPLANSAEIGGRFGFLVAAAEEPLLVRLFEAARVWAGQMAKGSRPADRPGLATGTPAGPVANDELSFLWATGATPFPVRLAREMRSAVAALASDPVVFIKAMACGSTVTSTGQRRLVPGIGVAILVYAVALSGAYAAYSISCRHRLSGEETPKLKVINLAPLPPMALRPTPPGRPASGGGAKHSSATARPIEPPPVAVKPDPRPLNQVRSAPEPQAEVAKASAGADPPGFAGAAANVGTSGNGTGTGRGIGSGNGQGVSSTASTDYGGVFSVSSVSVRPQMLSRPTPRYTDEARRAQVGGMVKLAVVLKADATVADIRVVRGLGFGLDEKAVEAARELRFVPAQKDGRPVSVQVFLEFKFELL